MLRMMSAGFAVIAISIESLGDVDLFRYAMTQGGLLVVVLVLLWSYRKDLKASNAKQDERIEVLTNLVATNTAAMTRAAAASEANEKAAHRLSRALDHFDEGRRR